MDQFSFFMAFYGVLLGLALTELLLGFGRLVRARRQPRWGILTPLFGFVVFLQIFAAFNDAWGSLKGITIALYSVGPPMLIGVGLFVAALFAVPDDITDWPDLDEYFLARRRTALSAILLGSLLTIFFLEWSLMLTNSFVGNIGYWVLNTLAIGSLLTAMLARSRRLVAAGLCVDIALMIFGYGSPYGIAPLTERLLGV